jgi:hypothetical protein
LQTFKMNQYAQDRDADRGRGNDPVFECQVHLLLKSKVPYMPVSHPVCGHVQ